MPSPDLSAIAKWPNVPACYDWLSLDRRGRWRLQGQPVSHAGLIAFINRQYGNDDAGNWFLQNGPQRVFVSLDYTPWVWRLGTDGQLAAHTGAAAGTPQGAYIDEEGSILVAAPLGIGLVDDRDLPALFAACTDAGGTPAGEALLLAAMGGQSGVVWNGLPLQSIRQADVPTRFGFQPRPAP